MDSAGTPPQQSTRVRWRRFVLWVLVAAVLAGGLYAGRGVLLQGLAGLLVIDDCGAASSFLVIVEGDRRGDDWYDEAARWYHEAPTRRILLIEPSAQRLVQTGVLPTYEARSRQALARRNVPREAVQVIPGDARDAWEEARLLGQWLSARPDVRVLVLCSRFQGRYHRRVLHSELAAEDAARVSICGVPGRLYDETNWWQSRSGVKAVLFAYLRLAYACGGGGSPLPAAEWDPDAYQRMLEAGLAEQRP